MTTEIIVNALCTEDKEVLVTMSEDFEVQDEIALQNGDTESFYVYDDRSLTIKEQLKE